ncbi:MAG: hypothetical protein ABJF04_04815 [Reichenbachiella sp.]|uniref:hypothetical protein n=1 Tax=Reichenbachiella sp. TaxID=2184521 RepID=UPI003265BD90
MKRTLFVLFTTTIVNTCLAQWTESTDGTKITTPDKVGIITSNPDANLTIGGNELITYNLKIKDQAGRSIEMISPTIGSAVGRLKISGTNSSLRLGVRDFPDVFRISGIDGHVGIGTSTSSSNLDVNGLLTISKGSINVHSIQSDATVGSDNRTLRFNYSSVNMSEGFEFYNQQQSKSLFFIRADGNIGIGNTSPDANLTIGGKELITYNLKIKDQVGRAIEIISPTQSSPVGRLKITDTNSNLALGVHSFPDAIYLKGSTGNVGIGTSNPDSDALLTVKGAIHSTEIKVLANAGVPDYVFEEDYDLRTLHETKEYIQENKHLPEIPSASEIEVNGGFNVGKMNMMLLKKIEELTLYQIELLERLEKVEEELQTLKN